MTQLGQNTADSQDEHLNRVLSEYLRAVETGEAPDRAELLARYPDLAELLGEFFANWDRLENWFGPLGAVPHEAGIEAFHIAQAQVTSGVPAPPVPAAVSTSPLADYQLLKEIGRGPRGPVYRALHISRNRTVALKVVLAGKINARPEAQRFHAALEAATRLDRPHILPIYAHGEFNGQHFYTMRLVQGGSLEHNRARLSHDPHVAARLLATVARALHDAHEHGLVHGGLCPGKILLDPGTEPVLAGFGISAPVLCEPGTAVAGWLSQSQEAIGYLAPELMLGSRALAPAVDVYSLGAILYVLLTGKPPFATAAPAEMLMQILCEEPAAPREHAPKVPAQLEAICLGCLNKERAKRPASALEVAEALEAFRDGKSISIPASTMAEPKARRANRRAPLTAAAAAGVMVAAAISFVIGGVLLTTYLQGERTQAAHDGRLAREELEAARLERSSVQKEKESALDQQQEAKQERDRALQRERLAEAQAEKVRREAQATVARLEQEKTDALRQGQLKAVEDLDRLSRQKAEAERKLAQSEAAQNALRTQLAGARVTASAVNWLAGWQSLWSRPIQAGDQTASRALPPDASGSAGASPSQAGTSPAPSQTPAAPRPLPTDASAKAQALSRPAEPAGPIVPARFSNPEQGSANSQKTPSAPAIKKPEAQVTEEETKRALSQGSAVLTVLLHPDAEMSVNGERAHRVAQHGARRVFITPPLPADGETYYYELNASWVDIDGRRLQRAGVVNVARGRSYVINLRPLQ